MMSDHGVDEMLTKEFARLRDDDARRTPAFGDVLARARLTVSATAPSPALVAPVVALVPFWRRTRIWAIAAPMALAAGLAAIWLQPGRAADREFETVVSEWSRISERSLHSPTDGLLALPGAQYLRPMPAFGSGTGSTRRPS